MYQRFLPILLGLAFCICGQAIPARSADNNPQPQADDLILPLPGGRGMAFRPVCLGAGGGSYAWRRFRLGDPAGGYKESPTAVALGGAFRVAQDNDQDWCYYLGKYEVSEDQVAALLPELGREADSLQAAANLSYMEVEQFVAAYNAWLYSQAQIALPRHGDVPGYLRLPTETEWEFAARGGNRVDSATFDRKVPYPEGALAEYEWFSGPTSSHNKLKQIGLLKPNVLGLHDMLGNLAEMTRSLYQIEYYQGRSGGFVSKGGHFLTDGKQLRSSLRTEQQFYTQERSGQLVPGRKQTLGFRLMISSLVFPNRQVSQTLKEDWDSYRQGEAKSLPAAVSTGPTSGKTQVSGNDAQKHLSRLREALRDTAGGVGEDVQQELDLLAASLKDIQFTIAQAEQDSAFAWVKIAGEQAFFLGREAKKLPVLQQLIESARSTQREEVVKKYVQRETEIRQNIEQAMSGYGESIRQLGTISAGGISQGLERYGQYLKGRQAEAQLALLPVLERHTQEYLTNQRTDDARWMQELMQSQP